MRIRTSSIPMAPIQRDSISRVTLVVGAGEGKGGKGNPQKRKGFALTRLPPPSLCSTANMHAGWPKFSQRAVGFSPTAVAVLLWAPLTARTPLATVDIATDYPFGDDATVTVTPVGADVPVMLRIPAWATAATLSVNGGAPVALGAANGTFFTSSTVGGVATTFDIAFNPAVRIEEGHGGAASVLRGALLYSLWIGQAITVTAQHPFNSQDLDINATAPWNVALVVKDRAAPGADLVFSRSGPPTGVPYNSTAIPVSIAATARVVPGWGKEKNAAAAPPASPACAAPGACGAPVPVLLVPFGSTHVRMAVLPTA